MNQWYTHARTALNRTRNTQTHISQQQLQILPHRQFADVYRAWGTGRRLINVWAHRYPIRRPRTNPNRRQSAAGANNGISGRDSQQHIVSTQHGERPPFSLFHRATRPHQYQHARNRQIRTHSNGRQRFACDPAGRR